MDTPENKVTINNNNPKSETEKTSKWRFFFIIFSAISAAIGIYWAGYRFGVNNGITDTSNNLGEMLLTQVKSHSMEKDSLCKKITLIEVKLNDTVKCLNNKIKILLDSNNILKENIIIKELMVKQYESEKKKLLAKMEEMKKKSEIPNPIYSEKISEIDKSLSAIKDSISDKKKEIKKNEGDINILHTALETNSERDKRINDGMEYYRLGLQYELEGDKKGILKREKIEQQHMRNL